jgi:predicted acylesterase/phospholipase RssA
MEYDTLVLSGGGVKGFCLLGGVQSAYDLGYLKNVKNYVGTSAGSMICYLLAIGYTPIEIVVALTTNKLLNNMKYLNIMSITNGSGALAFSTINECLENMTLNKISKFLTLGKLKELYGKTLICATYNMTLCKTEYLGPDNYPDLPCLTALRMSSNIPIVFDRFKYMDNFYIDGGATDNFPIIKGVEIGNKVLGIYLQIEDQNLQDHPKDGILLYFLRLMYIPMIQISKYHLEQVKEKCTAIPIVGEMRNIIEFDITSKNKLDMFSEGYTSVKNFFS